MTPSSSLPGRGAAEIIDELLVLTAQMCDRLDDADFLIDGVEKRQLLAEEFQAIKKGDAPMYASASEKERADGLLGQVAEMDLKIAASIEKLRDDAKEHLSSSKGNQRLLGYTNAAMSGSGSYMDYKK